MSTESELQGKILNRLAKIKEEYRDRRYLDERILAETFIGDSSDQNQKRIAIAMEEPLRRRAVQVAVIETRESSTIRGYRISR